MSGHALNMRWTRQVLIALVLLNGLTGASLWTQGYWGYHGTGLVKVHLAPGTMIRVGMWAKPDSPHRRYLPTEVRPPSIPRAVQVDIWEHNTRLHTFVHRASFSLSLRLIALLPLGAALALLILCAAVYQSAARMLIDPYRLLDLP
jgi:hypothetical protein